MTIIILNLVLCIMYRCTPNMYRLRSLITIFGGVFCIFYYFIPFVGGWDALVARHFRFQSLLCCLHSFCFFFVHHRHNVICKISIANLFRFNRVCKQRHRNDLHRHDVALHRFGDCIEYSDANEHTRSTRTHCANRTIFSVTFHLNES